MRKLILITSTAVLMPLSSWGEDITCALTKDCADLGYTETSCPDNNGVKCPWGDAWFCPPEKSEICEIGSILYSDMTCSTKAKAGKTPIGVVVYVDGTGYGQAISLDSIGQYEWGSRGKDVSRLNNYPYKIDAINDHASCENSDIIMATGDKDTYPAVWAAHEYSTEGTSAGDWCLPAAGVWASYDDNKITIDKGFLRAGVETPSTHCPLWSSTENGYETALEYDYDAAYTFYGLRSEAKSTSHAIYPVLEF